MYISSRQELFNYIAKRMKIFAHTAQDSQLSHGYCCGFTESLLGPVSSIAHNHACRDLIMDFYLIPDMVPVHEWLQVLQRAEDNGWQLGKAIREHTQ